MPTHVTALFADRHSAQAALEQLVQAGFTRDAISVLMSVNTYERQFGGERGEGSSPRPLGVAGVLAGIASAMAKLPALASGFALSGVGALAAAVRRVLEHDGASALESALEAAGFARAEASFIGKGLRRGSLAIAVTVHDDRTHLAARLLELSGGESLQAA